MEFQYIASGLTGLSSFRGVLATVTLGVVLPLPRLELQQNLINLLQ
jgi:hypothetical protein